MNAVPATGAYQGLSLKVRFDETGLPLFGVNVPFEVSATDFFAALSIFRPVLESVILSFVLPALFTLFVPEATTIGLRLAATWAPFGT
jgi:hypothetical protein